MKIGIMIGATGGPTLDGLVEKARALEKAGFDTVWLANIFGHDAIGALGIVGRETSKVELGTAVVPTYPRHPMAIGQQALTTQAAAKGRFALGIGLSHKMVIEGMLGMSYDKPANHMREYLEVLGPLLRGEEVHYEGEQYRVNGQLDVPDATPPQLLVAALGPVMLSLTGRLADGTITWMCGPRTLGEHIGPRLRQAAADAGRPQPRVVAGLPVVLTDDEAGTRAKISELLTIYGQLPSYRAMLDREGVADPADIAVVGNEAAIRAAFDTYRDLGVTDLDAAVIPVDEGAEARTTDFLASLL
ncbi:MAG: LLM class F420-dependent oxidoreductase [Acidobacteriota bacterium]|nr:LLM class F420-dependent oxidoreductase [Acidobacteriota bacterium]